MKYYHRKTHRFGSSGRAPTEENEIPQRKIPSGRKIKGWVGQLPSEVLPGSVPLGSLQSEDLRFWKPPFQIWEIPTGQKSRTADGEFPLELGLMGGLRPYYTSNVLRLNDNELSSRFFGKPVRDFRYPQSRRRSAGISVWFRVWIF